MAYARRRCVHDRLSKGLYAQPTRPGDEHTEQRIKLAQAARAALVHVLKDIDVLKLRIL